MKKIKQNHKEKGFSLPSVIVGSIIAAILGAIGLSTMWSSVDKANYAKVLSNNSVLSEISVSMVQNGVKGTDLSTNYTDMLNFIESHSDNLYDGWEIMLVQKRIANGGVINGVKAIPKSEAMTRILKDRASDLNLQFNKNGLGYQFSYKNTCADADGDGVLDDPWNDCLIVHVLNHSDNVVPFVDDL